ncbi:7TM GPCR, serpentine receptor class x (Srx) family-containing protein [Strongyloides ratti]|uniref:7TM GPCR, serpentine receptor class x (Srx) family-containing protein n=1 Tax=Strongyloides ratti TaxID=34506 RepID=A0A090LAI0_STRRB|nr:7TM GPCR, serpentine receptor class x (Srx) family-containing protein [Strongyloides ratti]CEF64545.1 7TM GPCR, serpentine receptor class x (Srx) family-containing protein [Strongyloides ratti]
MLFFSQFLFTSSTNINFYLYKIIKLWGTFAVIQQINHFISSIYTISFSLPPEIILRFFGSTLQCGYLTSVLCAFILTLNRFDAIYRNQFFPTIDREKVFNYFIYFCYFYAFIILCVYNIPDFGYYFYLQTLSFQYSVDQNRWRYIWEYENKSTFSILIFCLFIYLNIFFKILLLRTNAPGKHYKCSDIKLLVPALFEIILTLILEILWEYWLEPNSESRYKFVILNFLYILVSGTNTITSFLILKEVQNTAKTIFNCKKKLTCNRISSVAHY